MRTTWNFFAPGQIVFGSGAVAQVGELLSRRKLQRVFVVADERLAAAGIVGRVTRWLAEAMRDVEVYSGGQPEPSIDLAVQAGEAARAFAPDCILGLGGGSNRRHDTHQEGKEGTHYFRLSMRASFNLMYSALGAPWAAAMDARAAAIAPSLSPSWARIFALP